MSHFALAKAHWMEVERLRSASGQTAGLPVIDGENYSLASVVGVARFKFVPQLTTSPDILERVDNSARLVANLVSPDELTTSVYGSTTGFGGSANTRIRSNISGLQLVLVKGLQAGIIPPPKPDGYPSFAPESAYGRAVKESQDLDSLSAASLLMPESWVKGAIAIRLNALIRGFSGCRLLVIQALHRLLVENITPTPPLRQSISASGDLGPLAYIAGALIGDGKCLVWAGEGESRRLVPSPLVLKERSMEPLNLLPKEGLSIVNGTAPSCSVSALALHDAHFVLLLSQATTALAVEALLGTKESFDAFLSVPARPHPGQTEVAANILRALADSRLTKEHDEQNAAPGDRLRQDRYSLRTAPQWIGPQIEELLAVHRTVVIEINSTTDNPIIDASRGSAGNLCGGNFQGTSLTVAMEKLRIGLQHVGRIAYAQMVELGSPSMSRGLAPDLAANEPSIDYGQKALDIASASYLAELSFISNTVSNHVQPAEMHNQSLNSLALVSARYTVTAVQLTQMILANLLWSVCQAVDLRTMYARFFVLQNSSIADTLLASITPPLPDAEFLEICAHLQAQARAAFGATSTLDAEERFATICRPLIAEVQIFLARRSSESPDAHMHQFDVTAFLAKQSADLVGKWVANREEYFASGTAEDLLGSGTRCLYNWVRKDLGVPLRHGGQFDSEETDVAVSRIYEGIVRGEVNTVLLRVFDNEG
ncbi:putative phenylalanine ammonia-lyase [Mycena filopes]|nr:putative phenylalanine ammonia-lyase [Mycena filopes]